MDPMCRRGQASWGLGLQERACQAGSRGKGGDTALCAPRMQQPRLPQGGGWLRRMPLVML
jgi:hypothetical protein